MFLKRIITTSVFILLCFGMIELSYRYYKVGSVAFSPTRFRSLNMLLLSGLVQRSQYPGIFYELKPNLDALFRDIAFTTNSAGIADQEYSLKKADNTLRVAVLGSSWTMATGVAQEDTYHSVLETELSASSERWNYELLNFGVEYYGLREIVGTAQHRAMEWDPDILVVAITPFTARLRWDEPSEKEALPDQIDPLFQSYALRELDYIIGGGVYSRGLSSRPLLKRSEGDAYLAQIKRAFHELRQIATDKDIPVVVMWLAYRKPPKDVEQELRSLSAELDVIFVDTYNSLIGSTDGSKRGLRYSSHPAAKGHQVIAKSLREAMIKNELLPGL